MSQPQKNSQTQPTPTITIQNLFSQTTHTSPVQHDIIKTSQSSAAINFKQLCHHLYQVNRLLSLLENDKSVNEVVMENELERKTGNHSVGGTSNQKQSNNQLTDHSNDSLIPYLQSQQNATPTIKMSSSPQQSTILNNYDASIQYPKPLSINQQKILRLMDRTTWQQFMAWTKEKSGDGLSEIQEEEQGMDESRWSDARKSSWDMGQGADAWEGRESKNSAYTRNGTNTQDNQELRNSYLVSGRNQAEKKTSSLLDNALVSLKSAQIHHYKNSLQIPTFNALPSLVGNRALSLVGNGALSSTGNKEPSSTDNRGPSSASNRASSSTGNRAPSNSPISPHNTYHQDVNHSKFNESPEAPIVEEDDNDDGLDEVQLIALENGQLRRQNLELQWKIKELWMGRG